MTVPAVLGRTKTVTRRHPDTWRTLRAGDRLTLIEKGMGLAKGERQVVLAEVEVVDVRVEPLIRIFHEPGGGTVAEGLGHMTSMEFARLWLDSHGFRKLKLSEGAFHQPVRRIEWRYLDEPTLPPTPLLNVLGDAIDAARAERKAATHVQS